MNNRITIVGAGFAGLSAAAYLAREGYAVRILEKNAGLGGRARTFSAEGFTFDMGPSWYWMPEVFDNFFRDFGHTAADFYELVRLDPSYEVVFGAEDRVEVPASTADLFDLFERLEPDSSPRLKKFLEEAEYKYTVGSTSSYRSPATVSSILPTCGCLSQCLSCKCLRTWRPTCAAISSIRN